MDYLQRNDVNGPIETDRSAVSVDIPLHHANIGNTTAGFRMLFGRITIRHPLSFAVTLAGALFMALLAFEVILPPAAKYIGQNIYDLYTLALLEGHFDLPLRVLRGEGHYTPDGTGYLYHGLGPVLTRLPFVTLVQLPTPWIAPLSIWFWAVSGNFCYHKAFESALENAPFEHGRVPEFFRTLLALLVWFGSPGLLLTANTSFYIEPVGFAYALGGGFILLLMKVASGEVSMERALVPLSVLAGLTVHARPHLAVGFYASTCILAAAAVVRGSAGRKHAAAAMLVLALFGGLLLAVNTVRFHDPSTLHGGFSKGELQYGSIFWGTERPDSERAQGFREYGQFNARRILPNAAMYIAAIPAGGPTDWLRRGFETAFVGLRPWVGFIRLEAPNIGVLFLWPAWILLMFLGWRRKSLWKMPALAGMVATTIAALLLFSYATITLRYHVDLWPVIAFPATFGIGPLAAAMARPGGSSHWAKSALVTLIAAGILMTSLNVGRSRNTLQDDSVFPYDGCLRLTASRGFDRARSEELCRLPAWYRP